MLIVMRVYWWELKRPSSQGFDLTICAKQAIVKNFWLLIPTNDQKTWKYWKHLHIQTVDEMSGESNVILWFWAHPKALAKGGTSAAVLIPQCFYKPTSQASPTYNKSNRTITKNWIFGNYEVHSITYTVLWTSSKLGSLLSSFLALL